MSFQVRCKAVLQNIRINHFVFNADKLLIPVAGDPGLSRIKAGDAGDLNLNKVDDFDPDTLERGSDRRGGIALLLTGDRFVEN